MAKSKVYAVKAGRKPGIYTSWDECRNQVDGFPGALYKGFSEIGSALEYLGLSGKEAEDALAGAGIYGSAADTDGITASDGANTDEHFPEGVRAYVDGSYDIKTGRFSCGVVMIRTDADGNVKTRCFNQAFDDAEAAKQRNVAGEIMGAKLAIDFCLRQGIDAVEIYHDYEGVGRWPRGEWKAKNELTRAYADYVRRAGERMDISFHKVAAHTGNKYNEQADRLAKEALGK